ncbi:hypothetical protein DRE_06419 [Drechslerella stenobrocha 248]|uniref:Major facilitator superfamily (MFS) profile domain-containing protein n=1 Tax=Drechslerella stenobrocha 248 TaxID=1043628 RepID=W7HLB0_9PEZI|nr:hypothetical protein DRE_06419 [Drechslerella stenobrocha 248]
MGDLKDDTASERTPLLANRVNTAAISSSSSSVSSNSPGIEVANTTKILDGDVARSDEEYVGWLSLPKKKQLILLALCRLADPISSTSLLSYVYYFLRSLPGAQTPQEISRRAGMMMAAFSLCQFATGMIWGRLSDIYGRKPVIVVGLCGSMLTSLGLGFSTSFRWAVLMRMISGASNGTPGVLRTVVAELIKEKRYQSRAFLIMPMCMNVGIIVGPMLGGILANPIEAYPGLVGPGSWLGGEDGVGWMKAYPYALPNIVSAIFICASLLLAAFGMEETNPSGDIFGRLTSGFSSLCAAVRTKAARILRRPPPRSSSLSSPSPLLHDPASSLSPSPKPPSAIPLSEVLTPSITLILLSFIILPLHNTTFIQLYPIFLSTPRHDNSHRATPLGFTGGLGLPAAQVGTAMAALGVVGVSMQLLIYPPVQHRLGTLRSYRWSLLLFPLAYILTPFLAVLPSTTRDLRLPAAGPVVWAGIVATQFVQVSGRTFAAPGNVILLINSVENRRALGTVNGLGSSLASLARAVGPLSAGWGYGMGLEIGVVGAVWWAMAAVALFGVFVSTYMSEGKGFAQKEEEEEEEEEARLVKGSEPVKLVRGGAS